MRTLLLTLILAFQLEGFGQTESFNWNFGDGVAITFLPNGTTPVNLTGSQLKSGRGCASISDSCIGALLFTPTAIQFGIEIMSICPMDSAYLAVQDPHNLPL